MRTMLEYVQLIGVVANVVILPALGAIGWLLRSNLEQLKRGQADHEKRLTDHDAELLGLQRAIAEHQQSTCSKEDWLRTDGINRQKLESIANDIAEMKGQNDLGIKLAAAIIETRRCGAEMSHE